jgi:hydroxyacylglutathione hydrolase
MKTWRTSHGYSIIQVLKGRSNAFILANTKYNLLVDTGPARKRKSLGRNLDKLGIHRIDLLILTHAHFDHAGNAAWIKEKYGSPILVHNAEAASLQNGISDMVLGTMLYSRLLVKFIGRLARFAMRFQACQPDILSGDQYDLQPFGFNAFVMNTPGHTEGSQSVVVDHEIALVGDTMFGVFRNSIFPPFANDKDLLCKSWYRLLETGCKLYLPSHGTANSRKLVMHEYNRLK